LKELGNIAEITYVCIAFLIEYRNLYTSQSYKDGNYSKDWNLLKKYITSFIA